MIFEWTVTLNVAIKMVILYIHIICQKPWTSERLFSTVTVFKCSTSSALTAHLVEKTKNGTSQQRSGTKRRSFDFQENPKAQDQVMVSFRWACNLEHFKPLSLVVLLQIRCPSGSPPPQRAQPTSKCVRQEALKADCVLIKFIIGWGLIPVVISRRPKGKQDYSLAIIPMKLLGFSWQKQSRWQQACSSSTRGRARPLPGALLSPRHP